VDRSRAQVTTSERSLGLQWVVANVVGWLIGFAACEWLQSFLSTVFVDGLVIGSAVGISQWLVLRRRIPSTGWWIVLTIVSFGVGKALAVALLPDAATLPADVLTGAIIGAVVGIAQWLVLRRSVSSAAWWVPATAAAWAVGWSAIGAAEGATDRSTLTQYLVGGVGAAAAGLITAIALIWLLRSPIASAGSTASR